MYATGTNGGTPNFEDILRGAAMVIQKQIPKKIM